jgi:putative restriction endonuclease
MNIVDYFKKEISMQNPNYFILDTKGNGKHGDVDFLKYNWRRSRYNLMKEGDLFIYRRPSKGIKSSEFYFFGACKVEKITGKDLVTASFSKKFPFKRIITQSDLENFNWDWKERGRNWMNFFNQYGMNKIPRSDFLKLLKLSEESPEDYSNIIPEEETKAIKQIQQGSYFAEDEKRPAVTRSKQKAFSDTVKLNYEFKCGLCGIKTRNFLIGSHIIPWSENKSTRLDPANGICFCIFHDKAFDSGYISLQDDYSVLISDLAKSDKYLYTELKKIKGRKLRLPSRDRPKAKYLNRYYAKWNQLGVVLQSTVILNLQRLPPLRTESMSSTSTVQPNLSSFISLT